MKYLVIIALFLTTLYCNAQESTYQTKQSKKEKIIVYGSDSCHSCIDTKAFLKEKKIEFTYFDIDVNKEKEQEMLVKLQKAHISINTLSLPVIDNKGDVFLNQGNFKEFLKIVDKKLKKDEN
ncbi:glutaredoxin family protein [uncultured Polaribacter sp.]|uniref:glutaredoxin family protein n=1 Tax=uncultured Polaribacter sp. TaxID=174711 RepID=UPI002624CCC4|nr:glutaredoxin family protein [uncultured Polaribacter sp.]